MRIFKGFLSDSKKGALFFSYCHIALFISAIVTYLLLTNNHLGGADSAELLTASYNLGIAHPPGYPLFLVTAKLFSFLAPFKDIVFTYNLFSTLCFLLSLLVIWRTFSFFNILPFAIFSGGLFYVFSYYNMRWVPTSDVFPLHLLLCSLGIFLTARIIMQKTVKGVSFWLGLLAGLGAANHHTIVFLFPGFFVVYTIYWCQLPSSGEKLKQFFILICSFLTGTLFYLEPVLSSIFNEQPVSAFSLKISSFGDLSDLFFRKIYGTFNLTYSPDKSLSPFFWLGTYCKSAFLSPKGLSPILGISVFSFPVIAVVKKFKGIYLPAFLWLLGSFSFFLLVHSEPTGIFLSDHISRMYLMPNMIATICGIISIDYLIKKIDLERLGTQFVCLFLASCMIWWTVYNNIVIVKPYNSIDIQRQVAKDILDACEPNSVLLLDTDFTVFGVFYLQNTEKYRPDILTIIWPMTFIEQYRNASLRRISKFIAKNSYYKRKPTVSASNQKTVALSKVGLINALVEAGIPVYTLLNRSEESFGNLETENLTVFPKGLVHKFTSITNKIPPEQILRLNEKYINRYSDWLIRINFNRQNQTEKGHLGLYYLNYLHEMRNTQFRLQQSVLSTVTLDKLSLALESTRQK